MPTVTIRLNETYDAGAGLFPIIIRIEHQGKRLTLPVGFKVQKKFWKDGQVVGKHPDATLINARIAEKEAEIRRYLADCQLHGKPIHLDLIGQRRKAYSFADYLTHRSEQYRAAGKVIMYRKTKRFAAELVSCAGTNVYFEDIDLDFLRRLEQYQRDLGNGDNTRHKKFKFLREFYGQAIQEGKAPAPNPFKSYKVMARPVKKEKLSDSEIKAIEDLQLSPGPLNDARNLFLFSFYAKGQRFENCVTLRRDQLRNGRLFFVTNKGKDPISVKIHSRLQAILDQYAGEDFVFPMIRELPTDPEAYLNLIGSCNTIVNKNLKAVAKLAGIKTPLTFHIARHSFANQLKGVTDNIHAIKEALGHSDYRTTEVYLKSLSDTAIDGEMEKLYGV